ncbi:MAG: hypothetical protein V5783_05970 [Pontiella sp.]
MPEFDQNLSNTIAMLEQILEVMPQEVDALNALYTAHLKNGNEQRAFDYLIRIIGVAVEMTPPELPLLEYLQRELSNFSTNHAAEAIEQKKRVEILLSKHRLNEEEDQSSCPIHSVDDGRGAEVDLSEELALAWRLYEEKQLSQEEYSMVLQDLTAVSTKDLEVPNSVLHVLKDQGFSNMSQVMLHAASRSGMPFISLDSFEIDPQAAMSISLDYPAHEGALPFDFMGNDLLIGMLNPFNRVLMDKVEQASGHRCHGFLMEPGDYDAALGNLRAIWKAVA